MNNSSIRSILEKEKLNGNNFLDWYRNLRIVLRAEQKFYHLEEALPEAPAANATAVVRNAYTRRCNEQQEVACLMLASMIPELKKHLENLAAFDMLRELKVMFEQQAEQEEEGQSASSYVMKMKGYLDKMDRLGYPLPQILGKGMPKKAPLVLAINQGRIQKKNKGKPLAPGKGQGKGKAKLAYAPKPKIPPPAKKEHPAKDTVCHHCGVVGHWRRNCAAYLEGLRKNKASSATHQFYHLEEALPEAPVANATAAVRNAYVEKGMPKKAPLVLAINQGRIQKKNKGKQLAPGKGQGKGMPKKAPLVLSLLMPPNPNFPTCQEGAPGEGHSLPLLWTGRALEAQVCCLPGRTKEEQS
ncbi:zinc finger, CCHC-type [Artemisia annua]|uniref:Zinc finger, CCHC-type n=1 Tax=Artemisia annua TaxID=35608 RepID=A0A2U1LVV3_ARTAN|nr:zinc finger, CCHC-type [Artemisia annua]